MRSRWLSNSPTSSRSRSPSDAGKPLGGRVARSYPVVMWVGEIDVSDDDLVRRYWEAGREAEMFGRPFAVYWTRQSAIVAFQASSNSVEQHPIAAIVGNEV